jgi:hypothetical protein
MQMQESQGLLFNKDDIPDSDCEMEPEPTV